MTGAVEGVGGRVRLPPLQLGLPCGVTAVGTERREWAPGGALVNWLEVGRRREGDVDRASTLEAQTFGWMGMAFAETALLEEAVDLVVERGIRV